MYTILQKEALNPTVTRMVIDAPLIARKAEPGQFVILRVDEAGERIPLTVADFDREKGTVTIIFQIVGATTYKLNQLSAGEFSRLTGVAVPAGNVVAVRPETIGISVEEPEADDVYVLKGMVAGSMPRGNVLRYTVRVGQTNLLVDVLFRSFHMFDPGETVYLTLLKHDCLVIPENARSAA